MPKFEKLDIIRFDKEIKVYGNKNIVEIFIRLDCDFIRIICSTFYNKCIFLSSGISKRYAKSADCALTNL